MTAAPRSPSTTANRPRHHQPSAHGVRTGYDAVLFDMDGVVTDTASIHAAAWKSLFDSALRDPRAKLSDPGRTFDQDGDYRKFVDGRSREDGVAAYLGSRGVTLEPGSPSDAPGAWTIAGLAARKNLLFLAELAVRGLRVYPGTAALLERLHSSGIPVGLVTASRNAREMLNAIGLVSAFDVVVDGQDAFDLGLSGKPDPAMFLEAAARLGAAPRRTVVVEDAVSGVQAGERGGFGLVVGVDRHGHRAELEAAGADVVVGDVGELDIGASTADPWLLVYEGFDPAHEGHREALTALGNGYFATRGARPEYVDDGVHYPGTYLAGVYNRLRSRIHSRRIEEEHLVNAPNWLPLDIRIGDGQWWSSGDLETLDERRELDLRTGVSRRTVTLLATGGKALSVEQRSFVSMDDPHLAALETTVTALGWDGATTFRAGIDAGVRNTNVAAYIGSDTRHLSAPTFRYGDDTVLCIVRTRQSQVTIATATHLGVSGADANWRGDSGGGHRSHAREAEILLVDGVPVTLTKTAAVFTSRDAAIASPGEAAFARARAGSEDLADALRRHQAAWRRLWDRFSVTIDADPRSQLVLNLHVFHLLQSISPHATGRDAGVSARGLHGEGYRGHVFWDELFVMRVMNLRDPQIARSLLDYRWHRLGAARTAATQAGLTGALFPWQSGSDGREETPTTLYNPRSERWMPDNSHRQRHVGLAVAYNAWQHFEATGDLDWLAQRGAELIIEVTRMFTSSAYWDAASGRFHIAGVMGPDEYHDGYPSARGAGVRDNAYTNVLAAWVCSRAAEALDALAGYPASDLVERLQLTHDEMRKWSQLANRLAVPFHADGVISQFDGYEDLTEFDFAAYRDRYGNIGRLDLILESENDSTNNYRVSKQPDVVMLVYLLGPDRVRQQLDQLGYPISPADLERTVSYYLDRTSDGSTLSRVVNASVLAGLDDGRAWPLFREALIADLDDTQGGTTREGIHLGAMSGTLDLVIRCFAGVDFGAGELRFTPSLPARLTSLCFQIAFRGHRIDAALDQQGLRLTARPTRAAPIPIRVGTTAVLLAGGEARDFPNSITEADDNERKKR
jgi:beta-phosphoglucomutase family hydrolase